MTERRKFDYLLTDQANHCSFDEKRLNALLHAVREIDQVPLLSYLTIMRAVNTMFHEDGNISSWTLNWNEYARLFVERPHMPPLLGTISFTPQLEKFGYVSLYPRTETQKPFHALAMEPLFSGIEISMSDGQNRLLVSDSIATRRFYTDELNLKDVRYIPQID